MELFSSINVNLKKGMQVKMQEISLVTLFIGLQKLPDNFRWRNYITVLDQ